MNDVMLLQINRQRRLIPEERLKAAQGIQEKERAAGKAPRPLLDILATRGDLDSTTVRLIRTLMHRGISEPPGSNGHGTEATVVDAFHAVVESLVLPPPEPPPASVSRAGWPEEVVVAERDLKNLFGQFVLVAQVGSGGSGTVYRAWDRRVNRYSGLKILHTMEPSALERFTREARIAGNLQHPSIATIYEVGEQDGRFYIAMRYIDGKPIDADPRSIPECLALIRDACRALDYAHQQGIIHRDIKPANLLVDSQDRVYVTDFGIAKQTAIEHTSTLSLTGTIIGTPKYLPPEQARGEAKHADARSDVYSTGATLYTLLAGRAPFPSSNVWETLESVMKREPPPLKTLNAAVSPELEAVVAKAMSKDPANRFASAGELADELDRILQQRRYTGRYGLLRYLARKWLWVAAAGVVLGGVIHYVAVNYEPPSPPTRNVPITPESRYETAAKSLMFAWDKFHPWQLSPNSKMTPEEDRAQLIDSNARQLTTTLKEKPSHLVSKVLLARAHYLRGDRKALQDALAQLKVADDYRVAFLNGLVELEAYLDATRPPLPEPESRVPAWMTQHATPNIDPKGFDVPTSVPSILQREADSDRPVGQAVKAFLEADWQPAIEGFSQGKLPVFRKALHRATYLSRNWDKTLAQAKELHGEAPCWECLGARFGKACEPAHDNPIAALEDLRRYCAGKPEAEVLVLACIARRSVERGLDPSSAVSAGEALAAGDTRELRGVLRVASLRWKSLSGSDDESDYELARTDLTSDPVRAIGKLARIEARILLGERRRVRGGNYLPPLEEAVDWANAGNGWPAMRVLRAEAYLRLGRIADTLKELPGRADSTAANLRANLVAADAHLQAKNLPEARKFAKLAYDAAHDHPEALHLLGAVTLEEARAAADPKSKAGEAVDLLSLALERERDFVEARFDRACALYLLADADLSRTDLVVNRLVALADIELVLKKNPTLAPAKILRDLLKERIRRDADPKGVSK